jgi:hypothetical protein
MNRSQEEIQMALSIYQQELSKLTAAQKEFEHKLVMQHVQQGKDLPQSMFLPTPGVQDLSMPKIKRESSSMVNGEDPSMGSRSNDYDDESQEAPPKDQRSLDDTSNSQQGRHPISAFSLVRPKSESGKYLINHPFE